MGKNEIFYDFIKEHFANYNEIAGFCEIYKKVKSNEELEKLQSFLPIFQKNVPEINGFPFFENGITERSFFEEILKNSKKHGLIPEKYALLTYIPLLEKTKFMYQKYKIPQKIFQDTVKSISIFTQNYIAINADYGLLNYRWCANYLSLAVFRILGLEYQLCSNPFTNNELPENDGYIIKIHIPEGCDFSSTARKKSYQSAYKFFSDKLGVKKLLFVCESWLLARDHILLSGNISGFREDFVIIKEYSDYDSGFLWRLFGGLDLALPEKLPENTSLQRFYKQKLIKKQPFYSAAGYFVMQNAEDIWKK